MKRTPPTTVIRPPPPATTAVEAFLRGEDPRAVNVPETPPERPADAPQASAERSPDVHETPDERPPRDGTRALVERRGGRVTRRTTVHFRPDTFDALQAYCAAEGDDLSRVVDRAVREFLMRAKGDG